MMQPNETKLAEKILNAITHEDLDRLQEIRNKTDALEQKREDLHGNQKVQTAQQAKDEIDQLKREAAAEISDLKGMDEEDYGLAVSEIQERLNESVRRVQLDSDLADDTLQGELELLDSEMRALVSTVLSRAVGR